MDINQQKEQFSDAYVQAVASVAGYTLSKPRVDDDSVDWTISAKGVVGSVRSPKMDIQVKCTSRDVLTETDVRYPLEIKNYDELRMDDYQDPRILVVIVVPEAIDDWLTQSETALTMSGCGYWVSLRGKPPTTNTSTVTVSLPRTQQFTVDELKAMMSRIGSGDFP